MSFKDIDFENDAIAWVCHFGSEMRNRYIIEGFFKTANLIYDNIKENQPDIYEDDLVYPFLHTIRHTYELQLKFIMYNMYVFYKNYKDGIIDFDEIRYNEIKLKHSIGDLYNFIKDNYYKLDERCDDDRTNIELIYDLISDFIPEADLDPYRYAEDRQGNENMADITQVSFDKAVNSLQIFKEKTEAILFSIDKLDKEYGLGTYFKNISRHKIYLIAKELPDFEKWKESSFDDVRNNLKKKYNLSSNDLCKIINIIKDSRWLSYFINYNRKDYSEIYVLLKKCFIANIDDKKDSQVSPSISMENIKENLELTQRKHKIHKEFLKELSIEQIVIIYTYYRMGHEILCPENYDGILQESKEQQFVAGKTEGNINYFGSKLYGHNFINNVMSGVYSSGDYELFLMLLDFLHNETKIRCEEYDVLKNNLLNR